MTVPPDNLFEMIRAMKQTGIHQTLLSLLCPRHMLLP